MKNQGSSVDYFHLAAEFQELAGGRIDKIYRDGQLILFVVYTGKRKVNLVIDIPNIAYLSLDKPTFPAKPDGFCMFLRRRLKGARIEEIKQLGFDRIFKLTLQKDAKHHVYIELFGKGNFIVCDENDKILSLIENVIFADRALRGGVQYQPPSPHPNLPKLSELEFSQFFKDKEPVMALATDVGVGGEYAELVLDRAGIKKDAKKPDTKKLFAEVKKLFTYKPQTKDGKLYPFAVDGEDTESFSSAIASIKDPARQQTKHVAMQKQQKKQETKLEKIFQGQEKKIKQFEKEAKENQEKGELIYHYYQELKPLVKQIRDERKKLSEAKLKEKYKDHKLVAAITQTKVTFALPEQE